MKKSLLLTAIFYLFILQAKAQCTFGNFPSLYTTSGGWTDHTWIAKMSTLPSTATLTGLGLHTNTTSVTQYSMALYSNNGGHPGNVIAASGEGTMVMGQNTINVATPTVIPAGSYWILAYYNNNGTPVTNGSSTASIYYIYTPTGTLPVSTTTYNSTSGDIDFWAVINTPTITVSGPTTSCSGNTITLTASGAASYTWDSGITTTSVTVAPLTSIVYTVGGTGLNGCQASITTSIAVNALPSLTISGNNTVCAGSSVIETVSGASTYTWDNSSTSAAISLSPSTNTTYSVTGEDANGCLNTTSIPINVSTLPTLIISGNTNVCAGSAITETVSGAITYTWNNAVTTSTLLDSPATNTIYSVIGTDANGCTNTTSVSITVNALPSITLSGNNSICYGFSLVESVNGASTYTWDNGATTTTVSLSPTTNTVYSVSGTDANGCVNTATASVNVNPLPTVAISGNGPVCSGASLTLFSTGAVTYSWSNSAFTNSVLLSPSTSTIIFVDGFDANGCSNQASVTISVNPLPILSVIGNTSVCEGSSLTQTVNGAVTYNWSNGSITSSVSLSPSTSTVYSVSGTDANGCLSTINESITVNPSPVLTIALSNPTLCAGETGTITAGNAVIWLWDTGATTMFLSVNPAVTTTYTVTGTNSNGCSSSTIAVQNVSNCTGIKTQILNNTSVAVYPNPGQDLFHLSITNLEDNSIMEIFNSNGSLVAREKLNSSDTIIHLENEASGFYYLMISNGNERLVTKLIKE